MLRNTILALGVKVSVSVNIAENINVNEIMDEIEDTFYNNKKEMLCLPETKFKRNIAKIDVDLFNQIEENSNVSHVRQTFYGFTKTKCGSENVCLTLNLMNNVEKFTQLLRTNA